MTEAELIVSPHATAAVQEAAQLFVAIAQEAVALRGVFTVALAGGSTPANLYRLLAEPQFASAVDWHRTFVYFGDERCVPPDHPDSNYRMIYETLLAPASLPPANVFRMAGEQPVEAAAQGYAALLRRNFRLCGAARPRLDLVLLGMGEDGHTASLFPGMPALRESRRLVTESEVPGYARPAVSRITLTFPVLNAGRCVLFLVTGASKAAAMHDTLSGPPSAPLPARQVQPAQGRLIWLLDEAAAAELKGI